MSASSNPESIPYRCRMGGAPVLIAKSTVLALASTAPRLDPKSRLSQPVNAATSSRPDGADPVRGTPRPDHPHSPAHLWCPSSIRFEVDFPGLSPEAAEEEIRSSNVAGMDQSHRATAG